MRPELLLDQITRDLDQDVRNIQDSQSNTVRNVRQANILIKTHNASIANIGTIQESAECQLMYYSLRRKRWGTTRESRTKS